MILTRRQAGRMASGAEWSGAENLPFAAGLTNRRACIHDAGRRPYLKLSNEQFGQMRARAIARVSKSFCYLAKPLMVITSY
jgi:hypothetical protein